MSEDLSTFVVPLQKNFLLIPHNTVAEVISYEPLQRVQDTQDWFLGFLSWRGIQVPVVSFEMLSVTGTSFSLVSVSSASLVVLRVFDQDAFSYMALVAQAMPRLTRIGQHHLQYLAEPPHDTELMRTTFDEEPASIPNLSYIESRVFGEAFSESPQRNK